MVVISMILLPILFVFGSSNFVSNFGSQEMTGQDSCPKVFSATVKSNIVTIDNFRKGKRRENIRAK
jgi:hypothetical protein